MMKELKTAFKLMKYGYQFKLHMRVISIFLVLSLIGILVSPVNMLLYGVTFLLFAPLVICQVLAYMFPSGLLRTSPKSYFLEMYFFDIIQGIVGIGSYLLVAAVVFARLQSEPEMESAFIKGILVTGCLIALVMLYFTFSNKFNWQSAVCYVVFYIMMIDGYFLWITVGKEPIAISYSAAVLIGFVIALIGMALAAVFRRILYTKENTTEVMPWKTSAKG